MMYIYGEERADAAIEGVGQGPIQPELLTYPFMSSFHGVTVSVEAYGYRAYHG